MANEIIRQEFLNRVHSAIVSARNVSEIDHAGIRGRSREIFLQKMLQPILPPYVEFGSGKIADSKGNLSAETDIIIYSKQTLPPLLFEANFGLYPVEACIYAIEVKSKLTTSEIQSTIEKFKRLQDLSYLPPILNHLYQPTGGMTPPVIPLLFAFSSDLSSSGKDELERYRNLDKDSDKNPAIPVFCVAGKGYWWFKPNEPAEKWIKHLPTEDNEEVVELIGGIANTIPEQVAAKGRPRFGQYILRERNFEKH
ncbi:MAG: hypothetical protein H6635_00050 [Anaerolineales bacterium]|nr:hypothetical protein [Anaerolineales bacterium]